jgi:helicase
MTASAADEPAWENPRAGHGYFTHFLIEALKGAEGVIEAGKLPVLAGSIDHATGHKLQKAKT